MLRFTMYDPTIYDSTIYDSMIYDLRLAGLRNASICDSRATICGRTIHDSRFTTYELRFTIIGNRLIHYFWDT